MIAATCALATGLVHAGVTDTKEGQAEASCRAPPALRRRRRHGDLAKCDKPMGAVAVVEPQDYVAQSLAHYGLGSPVGLIRLMIQQSNCFIVVERGIGMQNMMQERALADSGQLRQDSNMGGGQMVTADYILTPAVVFSEDNAGGAGGAVGGLLGKNKILAGVVGGLKFKEAQTSMLLADARQGIQVAAAEGSAKKADFALGGLLGVGAGGGYSNTNEGKIIAASLADNYNGIVQSVRNDPSLQRDVGTLAEEAAKKTVAGAVYNEGDVVHPKIGERQAHGRPERRRQGGRTLTKGDELVYMGAEQDGYMSVESGAGSGWVKKALVSN
jgi:curli biogenesis system outer membrane secretion channel CsgG